MHQQKRLTNDMMPYMHLQTTAAPRSQNCKERLFQTETNPTWHRVAVGRVELLGQATNKDFILDIVLYTIDLGRNLLQESREENDIYQKLGHIGRKMDKADKTMHARQRYETL